MTCTVDEERAAKALRHLDVGARGLEIGPSYDPLLPKSSGRSVEILDHAPRAELVAKYEKFGLAPEKISQIEEVDYIWNGGSLADVIGEDERYDFIIASHFIEHTVDLVGFLQDCRRLLRPSGRLALVIPDMRFCFDRFKPLSSLGDVVDAHVLPTIFHPPGAQVDHIAYACSNGGAIAWSAEMGQNLSLQHDSLVSARPAIDHALAQLEYHDVHRWKFTPTSFRMLVEDLYELNYHDFAFVGDDPTAGFEFFATLARDDGRHRTRGDRLTQIRQIQGELLEVQEGYVELKGRNAELQITPRRVDDLTDELDYARQELSSMAAVIVQRENQLSEIQDSTSWKVTAPLRRAGALLRRTQ